MNILHAMQDAKYVQVDGHLFTTGYLRLPDDTLRSDDIVLEATSEDNEIELTFDDVRDANQLEPGVYRLRSGSILCFLTPPTVH